MILPDVNVLVYTFRKDVERHSEYRGWLERVLNGSSAFGVSEQVLSSVVRIATHPKIFRRPSTSKAAFDFARSIREHSLCRIVQPGGRHWSLFEKLCLTTGAKANLVTDAWHASLAIESGCTWITTDRDFARFPGLSWMHPLDHETVIRNRDEPVTPGR